MSSKLENPCRPGTAAFAAVAVLMRSKGKRIDAKEIAKRSRLKLEQSNQVLNALTNPFHNSALRRAGFALKRDNGTFSLGRCEPEPNAHRPKPKKKAKRVKSKAKPRKRPIRATRKLRVPSPTPVTAPPSPAAPPVATETK